MVVFAPAAEREVELGGVSVLSYEAWASAFPHVVQGITHRGSGLDFGHPALTSAPANESHASARTNGWARLGQATGLSHLARCRQVHGARVALWRDGTTRGIHVLGEADALVSSEPDVLLAVTVADCVPVYLLDPERRIVALAHAGWRGIAAGVVEATLGAMRALGSEPAAWHVLLGPAICGRCYEVGQEVCAALGLDPTAGSVDLRERVARIVVAAGVSEGRVWVSRACTRCEREWLFSYRGGDEGERMCAFLGWSAG